MIQPITNPIGIFDSGMGGLTVAKTITTLLPNESIVYFGDTAHAPWGDKSVAAIQSYALKICEMLLQHHCKVIVIACHTASTVAFEFVKEYIGDRAYVLNVVDPVIDYLKTHHTNQKIGLIGTKQTVRSNAYQKRIDSLDQNIELIALATPLLAPLIEEGFAEHPISEVVVKEYLSRPLLKNLDTLILGCTHYPLLKRHIQKFYHQEIDIIDASETTAIALKKLLSRNNLLNPKTEVPKKTFYASDCNDFFVNTAKVFFPEEISLEPYPLWE